MMFRLGILVAITGCMIGCYSQNIPRNNENPNRLYYDFPKSLSQVAVIIITYPLQMDTTYGLDGLGFEMFDLTNTQSGQECDGHGAIIAEYHILSGEHTLKVNHAEQACWEEWVDFESTKYSVVTKKMETYESQEQRIKCQPFDLNQKSCMIQRVFEAGYVYLLGTSGNYFYPPEGYSFPIRVDYWEVSVDVFPQDVFLAYATKPARLSNAW